MNLYVSAEDTISRAVIEKMVNVIANEPVNLVSLGLNHGGLGYIKNNLSKFCDLATRERVIVLTDLDQAQCAPSLRTTWLKTLSDRDDFPEHMLFCIAVREVEAWLMADNATFASFFSISVPTIAGNIENTVNHPKEYLVAKARRSSDRRVREAIVPEKSSNATVGLGYNQLLSKFVKEAWGPERGASSSTSLQRAIRRLQTLLNVE